MIGESPTRPFFFMNKPLVEVPDTISPLTSSETMPTVSCPEYGDSSVSLISLTRL